MTPTDTYSDDADNFYAKIGQLLGTPPIQTEIDLLEQSESGLDAGSVYQLQSKLSLTNSEVDQLFGSRRTLRRRISNGNTLSAAQKDRAFRVARIAAVALRVFGGNVESAMLWLRGAQSSLAGRMPLQLLTSETGALLVEERLIAIEEGIY